MQLALSWQLSGSFALSGSSVQLVPVAFQYELHGFFIWPTARRQVFLHVGSRRPSMQLVLAALQCRLRGPSL